MAEEKNRGTKSKVAIGGAAGIVLALLTATAALGQITGFSFKDFLTRDQATHPSPAAAATAPPAARSPTPSTAPSVAAIAQAGLEMPAGYVGTWLGSITQAPSGANPTSLKVVLSGGRLGDRIGTATLGVTFACTLASSYADITLQTVQSDSISVTFANQTTSCLDSYGRTTTVRIVGNQLDWDLYNQYGEWRGRLSKTG
jgi:hypothetical protein